MGLNLSKDVKVTRVMNAVAAGTSEQKSSVLDMQDFDGVVFILLLGTVTDASVITLTAYENTASSTSSPTPTAVTPAAGPATASTDSNHALLIDVYRPQKRYIFADVLRTTQNAAIDGIIAIQYRGRVKPTTHDTGVIATALATGV